MIMPPPLFLINPNFLIELVYSVILTISCLIIYFKTSEIYKLTSHKGIKYFRMTFLFFAASYFLRFFTKMFVLGLIFTGTRLHAGQFIPFTSLFNFHSNSFGFTVLLIVCRLFGLHKI